MAGSVLFFRLALCALGLLSLRVKGLDHGGKEFYVTFLPYVAPNYEDVKLFITTPEQVSVTFTISAPGMGYTRNTTVDPGGVKEFTFKGADYALRNTTDRSKGIIIKTENERQIFVYGAQQVPYSMDSFLVLPPHDLGAKSYTYMAAMIHTRDRGNLVGGWKDIHALIGIVSVEDCTHLTITPTRNVTIGAKVVAAGDSINVTLRRAETLLIQCVGDLTGTKVTSNRPISFFCGDQCPHVPRGVGACDQIVEQLPPVEAWGKKFATVPLKMRRSFDVFRIVAASQGTTVNITCMLRNGDHGSVNTYHLNEGGFADVQVQSAHFCWVEADKRILLLQFAIGQKADGVGSDPFMALVPAVSQYTNVFTLPMVRSRFSNYLNIIIPAEHYQPDQIFLDSQSLQSLSLEFVAIVHNGETMAYATQVTVSATTHTLMHGNSSGVIGVVAYGFAHGNSYGHTGGLQLPTHFKEPQTVDPVIELTALEITSTSFTIAWKRSQGDVGNGDTFHCHIVVTDMEGRRVEHHSKVNCTVPNFRVLTLTPDHVYKVAIGAVLREEVAPSVTIFVKTGPTASPTVSPTPSPTASPTASPTPSPKFGPDPPTQLTALEITSTSLTITWKPSRSIVGSDDTVNYLINVTDTEGKKVVLHNKDNGAIPVLRVAKLDPDHVYQVTVAAVSGERISPSVTLFIKTYLDPSPVPETDYHSIILTIVLGSVIGGLLLVLIVAVMVGICICVCLHTCNRQPQETKADPDGESAIYDTIPGEAYPMQPNPAYGNFHEYQKPTSKGIEE